VIYLDAGPFQGMRRLKPATVVQTSVQH
jgi:hypothetical protein